MATHSDILAGESYGQLAGYTPQGRTELHVTEATQHTLKQISESRALKTSIIELQICLKLLKKYLKSTSKTLHLISPLRGCSSSHGKNNLITSIAQIPGSIQSLESSKNLNINQIPIIKYACTYVYYTCVCIYSYIMYKHIYEFLGKSWKLLTHV